MTPPPDRSPEAAPTAARRLDLPRRMREHRGADGDGFVSTYNLHALVYTEAHADPRDAIVREKRIKRWRRDWKLDLIRSVNPTLRDLWTDDVRPW